MYWADWGNHPKIETAGMDGTMRETLVEKNIQWPTGKKNSIKDLIIFIIALQTHPLLFPLFHCAHTKTQMAVFFFWFHFYTILVYVVYVTFMQIVPLDLCK